MLLLTLAWALGCTSLFGNPCPERPVCAESGQCSASHKVTGEGLYRCYVGGAADCAGSVGCTQGGRCDYDPRVGLTCIRPGTPPVVPRKLDSVCRRSVDCARWGRCALVEGACLTDSEDDCRASLDCVIGGRCSKVGDHCFAASQADCEGSLECTLFGRCRWNDHPLLGGGAACEGADQRLGLGCTYTEVAARRCAETGECLQDPSGTCRTAAELGVSSPALDDARRAIRGSLDFPRPSDLR